MGDEGIWNHHMRWCSVVMKPDWKKFPQRFVMLKLAVTQKLILATALIVPLLANSGCSVFQGTNNAIGYASPLDDMMVGVRNQVWARRAYNESGCQFGYNGEQGDCFRDGFIDGYCAVCEGGGTCVPAIPPRKYWSWRHQSGDGQARTDAWFAGYPEGARIAQEQGMGRLNEIQVADYITSIDGQAPFVPNGIQPQPTPANIYSTPDVLPAPQVDSVESYVPQPEPEMELIPERSNSYDAPNDEPRLTDPSENERSNKGDRLEAEKERANDATDTDDAYPNNLELDNDQNSGQSDNTIGETNDRDPSNNGAAADGSTNNGDAERRSNNTPNPGDDNNNDANTIDNDNIANGNRESGDQFNSDQFNNEQSGKDQSGDASAIPAGPIPMITPRTLPLQRVPERELQLNQNAPITQPLHEDPSMVVQTQYVEPGKSLAQKPIPRLIARHEPTRLQSISLRSKIQQPAPTIEIREAGPLMRANFESVDQNRLLQHQPRLLKIDPTTLRPHIAPDSENDYSGGTMQSNN